MSLPTDDTYESPENHTLSSLPKLIKLKSCQSLPELSTIKDVSEKNTPTFDIIDISLADKTSVDPFSSELFSTSNHPNFRARRYTLNDIPPPVLMVPSVCQMPCLILTPPPSDGQNISIWPTTNLLGSMNNSYAFRTLRTQEMLTQSNRQTPLNAQSSENGQKNEQEDLDEEKRKMRQKSETALQKNLVRKQLLLSFKQKSCSSLTRSDIEKVLASYCHQEELVNNEKCVKFTNKTSIAGMTASATSLLAASIEAISNGLGTATTTSIIGSSIILVSSMFGYLVTHKKVQRANQRQTLYDYLKEHEYPKQLRQLQNYFWSATIYTA
jgi:hypothetical protein